MAKSQSLDRRRFTLGDLCWIVSNALRGCLRIPFSPFAHKEDVFVFTDSSSLLLARFLACPDLPTNDFVSDRLGLPDYNSSDFVYGPPRGAGLFGDY